MTTSSASSSTISAPLNSSSPTPGLIKHHHVITIKLNCDNYLLWKAQLISYLRGQHLLGYVDGTTPTPPQMISKTSKAGETSLLRNPTYAKWIQQDQIILSPLSPLFSNLLWPTLLSFYCSWCLAHTWAHGLFSIKSSDYTDSLLAFHTQERLSLSVTEYFQKLKQLVDTLAVVHRPLDDFEVNSYLLAVLSSDYESVVASIQMLATPMSLDELYGHLLTHEQCLT